MYLFSVFLGMGAAIGLAWITWRNPAETMRRHLDASIFALVGGLVGGRLVYVAAHWPYFQSIPYEIPQIFLGGLAWIGVVIGGILAISIYAGVKRESLGELADALLPLAVMLIVAAWLGCLVDGCAYGPPLIAWWALPTRDEWGTIAPRFPVQVFGAIITLGLFWLIDVYRERLSFPGQFAVLGLILFSLLFFTLSFLRIDPNPVWYGLRLDTWVALGVIAVGFGIMVVAYRRSIRRNYGIMEK